jgi:6,7-dimethyl-8-ribityllumazine synthase
MSTVDAELPVAPRIEGMAPHLLVVRAPYYVAVVDGLRDGAVHILEQAGASFDVLDVAGALELAGAVRLAVRAAGTGASALEWGRRYDGFVALGCVVHGETDHYEHVCRETMSGLTQVTLRFGLCLGIGVLTVNRAEEALARSGPDGHNKGAEAAVAALLQIRAARWLGAV